MGKTKIKKDSFESDAYLLIYRVILLYIFKNSQELAAKGPLHPFDTYCGSADIRL